MLRAFPIVASREIVEMSDSEAIFRRSEAFRKLFLKRFDVHFLYNGFHGIRKLLFDVLKLFGSSFGSKNNYMNFLLAIIATKNHINS